MTTASNKEIWIQEAIAYMDQRGVFFEESEKHEEWAYQLADSLFEGAIGLDGVEMTPQEAVDEELTYWGD